jgi:hypothetical protein
VVNTPISIRCGGGLGQCISLLECVPVNSDVYSRGLGSRFAGDALIIDGDDECAGDVDRGGGTRSGHSFFLYLERKGKIFFSIRKGKESFILSGHSFFYWSNNLIHGLWQWV